MRTHTTAISDRRRFLRRLATSAGGVGLAATAGTSVAAADGAAKASSFDVDVTIHTDTFRLLPAPGSAPPVAGHGTAFIVEGEMFEGGTLPEGEGVDTSSVEIQAARWGTWFCRGWFINTPTRPDPHIISHQDFFFGEDVLTPHMLVTSGAEGTTDPAGVLRRAVVGGCGDYVGARGETRHRLLGQNTVPRPGSNVRFTFELI